MRKKKHRFPHYVSVIGKGTEVVGEVRFVGGLHVEGRVVGDVIALQGKGAGLTLGASGVVEGGVDVPHVVLDGTVTGDVRAQLQAVLASGARIGGSLFYGALESNEGAAVEGELVPIERAQAGASPEASAPGGEKTRSADPLAPADADATDSKT